MNCPKENECPYSCPWVLLENGKSQKCPEWEILVNERKETKSERDVWQMVLDTGKKFAANKMPRWGKYKNHTAKYFQEIKAIPESPDFLFYICSPHGTGKTTALIALTIEWRKEGKKAVYTTAVRMRKINAFQWHEDTREKCLKEIESHKMADILIIDEIDKEDGGEGQSFRNNLEPHLDSPGKNVILVGNVWPIGEGGKPDKKFPFHSEPWIMDRICRSIKIGFGGKSYRGPGR